MLRWRKLHNHDLILLLLTVLLSIFGLLAVFTTTFSPDQPISRDLAQQIIFFVLGFTAYVFVSVVDLTYLNQRKVLILLFLATIVGLVLVYFGGGNGPKRWLQLGDFSLQPSEFAKLTLILITAGVWGAVQQSLPGKPTTKVEHKSTTASDRLRKVFGSTFNSYILKSFLINLLGVVAIVGLIWRQPSLGNALITSAIWLLLLSTLLPKPLLIYLYGFVLLAGINLILGLQGAISPNLAGIDKQILSALIILVIGCVIVRSSKQQILALIFIFLIGTGVGLSTEFAWNRLLTGYQRDRVTAFLEPESDPLGSQWQVNQSKLAISSAQLSGKGMLQGTQSRSDLLPYDYTDFIYAAFVEQFGAPGSLILLGLIYLICVRCIMLATHAPDNFSKLVCIGVAIMLAMNTIINVGMNQGVMPVTGVPLPLVSYGGSAVLVNLLGLGLVQLVQSEERSLKATKLQLNLRHGIIKNVLRS